MGADEDHSSDESVDVSNTSDEDVRSHVGALAGLEAMSLMTTSSAPEGSDCSNRTAPTSTSSHIAGDRVMLR